MTSPWAAYVASFDHGAAVRECHPASVSLVVGMMVATALVARYVPFVHDLTGFHCAGLPMAFAFLGGACSLGTWFSRGRTAGRIALFQILDVVFYGMVPISMAVLSERPAAHVFGALYLVMLLRWGLFYSLTLIGTLSAVGGPLVLCGIARTDALTWMIVVVAGLLYVNTALNTRRRRVEENRSARSADVIKRIDALLLERHEAAGSELRTSIAVLMHKLKNELGPIIWNLDFVRQDEELKPEIQQSVAEAQQSLERATEIARGFLRETAEEGSEENSFSLPALTQGLAEEVGRGTGALKITCSDIPNVLVRGSSDYMRLALLNLVENAERAGAAGIAVSGEIQEGGTRIKLRLRDDGPGLPQPAIDRLFEPFNSHGKRKSTGVGLYLSRRMIETMGGTLTLESSGVDGACFAIVLPVGTTRGSIPPPSLGLPSDGTPR